MPAPFRLAALLRARLLLLAIALAAPPLAAPAAAAATAGATVHGVPLPRGTRIDPSAEGLFLSGQTFRKTVDHIARWLDRQGLAHDAVPIYRYRGIEVARFVSQVPATSWLAIHVFRRLGTTSIYIVPRPGAIPSANPPSPS
jgi:hypothetical protein